MMRIVAATTDDIPDVQEAYAAGRAVQRATASIVWPEFPDSAIRAEIDAGFLWRVVGDDGRLAAVFSLTDSDTAIWGERERDEHLYIHRMTRAAGDARRGLVPVILAWARERARACGRAGLRMDTWAENAALIAYYVRLGFTLVERKRIAPDPRLLPHYYGVELALLEWAYDAARSASASSSS